MVTDSEVLEFFRNELPVLGTWTGKMIPLQIDEPLQYYTDFDDLAIAIDKYAEHFKVDVTCIDYDSYYPWEIAWFFRKWFIKEPVKQISKPLTVKMFAESAKAGRWLYD